MSCLEEFKLMYPIASKISPTSLLFQKILVDVLGKHGAFGAALKKLFSLLFSTTKWKLRPH